MSGMVTYCVMMSWAGALLNSSVLLLCQKARRGTRTLVLAGSRRAGARTYPCDGPGEKSAVFSYEWPIPSAPGSGLKVADEARDFPERMEPSWPSSV